MFRRIPIVLCLIAIAGVASSQSQKMIDRIVYEGRDKSQVADLLWHLTKQIGGRPTGTPPMDKANAWAMSQLITWGCQDVRLEEFGTFPIGFRRGERQSAKIFLGPPPPLPPTLDWSVPPGFGPAVVSTTLPWRWIPWEKTIDFSTPAWSPGTNGPVRGPAIMEPRSLAELEAVRLNLKGAWIVMHTPVGMRGPVRPTGDIAKALDDAGIAGRVYSTGQVEIWTHGSPSGITWDNLPSQVLISIGRPDYKIITQHLAAGTDVQLEFDIENVFIRGARPLHNVIADIRGTEKPDEYVILSAHFDSWDGPGSEGASDNGSGSVVMMEAMRILKASNVRPKRTIRLVLWGGEEQGLLGSRAYVDKHRESLPKISAMFNDDGGSNYQGGLAIVKEWKPFFDPLAEAINRAFPGMPFTLDVVETLSGGGGSDHASFNRVGVPGLHWYERGRQQYRRIWHTQFDTYEEAIPEYLVQSATNSALAAYLLAMNPELLPRPARPEPAR